MSAGTLLELLGREGGAGALIDEGRVTPWSTVREQARRAAVLLREHGVGPGERVAILARPGHGAAVLALGTLGAGAAYVPIDSLSPARRNALIIADARPLVLVVESVAQASALLAECDPECGPEFGPVRLVVVLADELEVRAIAGVPCRPWTDLDGYSAETPTADLDLELEPGALAYILFTSGSTGRPKGVAISHRAARSFVDWACAVIELGPGDRVAGFTPLHFDLSVFDLYASMAADADLLVVPRRLVGFPSELAGFLVDQQASVIYTVPSVLTQLALRGQLEARAFDRLRAVLFAGEVFPPKHLRALMQALPGRRFLNLYGPTETNVCSYHELLAIPQFGDPPTPIGRACAGAELFALDPSGRAIGPGEIGELCVRGPVLMQGYWGREPGAGLVPDPTRAGALIYRTGDLVSVDAEDRYTWVGRSCQTIKSAGYRIEPGEIEHCLLAHPDVSEACVLARPHPTLGSELEAVVVLQRVDVFDPRALLAHCAASLPRYMIPRRLWPYAELPRLSTGKVDRHALLASLERGGPDNRPGAGRESAA